MSYYPLFYNLVIMPQIMNVYFGISVFLERIHNFIESYCEYYMNNESFECAQVAAGSAIELTKAILDNKVQNGLALIRPPGHHAMKEECNGFCIFNNIAIAGKFKEMLFVF